MMWSVWRGTQFVSCSYPQRRSRETRKDATHVRERLLHARQRIVGLDLVLQIYVTGVLHSLELPEDLRDRDLSLPDDALTLRHLEVAQILGVHVQQARARIRNCPHDVGPGAHSVSQVDA